MFSLAFSILFLAQTVPGTSPATSSDTTPIVRTADTAPAATILPAQSLASTGPSTTQTLVNPALVNPAPPALQTTLAGGGDAGKSVTVTGPMVKVDPAAKLVTVKTDSGTTTYKIGSATTITLDGAPSNLEGLASAGNTSLTVTTDSTGENATSVVAKSPNWLERILGSTSPIYLMIIPLGLFMVFSIRNKKKQERAQQEKLGSIKRGDRIQTIGGIMGNVVQTEDTRILVKVDESNNTKIWFTRAAVARVVSEEKPEVKAK